MADYNSEYTGAQIDDGVGRGIVRSFGWQDFQDTATATAPISLANIDTWYDITNNALGPLSSTTYKVADHGTIWDASTNTFDFSTLKVGDLVRFRTDMVFTTSGSNREIFTRLAYGPSFSWAFSLGSRYIRYSGDTQETRYMAFTIKSAEAQQNPAKIQCLSDAPGSEVVVNGWQVETQVFVP